MRILRLMSGVILALASFYLYAQQPEKEITVTGKLGHVMAIGGETTGWAIALDPVITVGGKQVNSIQVSNRKDGELEKFENQRVKATGILSQRTGVETGEQPVLNISSIKVDADSKPALKVSFTLTGSQWKLEDLAGGGVIDHSAATLAFPEAGKIAGNDSCNSFFGNVEINGTAIKLMPLGATRMACPEAVMNQETKYMDALQAAERFEWKDPYLLVYCKGYEKPLRFTRLESAKP
jgi:heat shock protein HslJ